MNALSHRISISFGFFCVLPTLLLGTFGTQEVDRDEFFRRMEARAMSLSEKMAGLSGTEPIKLITPKKESSVPTLPERQAPQQYYNALPGPPEPEPEAETELDIESNQTVPPSVVYEEPEASYYEIKPTSEELKGAFHLRPFVALQAPVKTVYSEFGKYSLTGKAGFSVGFVGSRRIGNWTGNLRFGYLTSEYSGEVFNQPSSGELELLSLSAQLGHSLAISDNLSLESSLGIGYGSRTNEVSIIILGQSDYYSSSDSSATFDLGLGLEYKYSETFSAFLGYRLMGVSDNGPYDRMTLHLFELGLGANF